MNDSEHSIVLFDGVCNFCNGSVRWIIRHDKRDCFRFAPLQSAIAEELRARYRIDPETDSLILIEGKRAYLRSTAALRIVQHVGGLWPLLYALIAIPRPVRDFAYDCFARRRYRWFGKREECMVPSERARAKFLE